MTEAALCFDHFAVMLSPVSPISPMATGVALDIYYQGGVFSPCPLTVCRLEPAENHYWTSFIQFIVLNVLSL